MISTSCRSLDSEIADVNRHASRVTVDTRFVKSEILSLPLSLLESIMASSESPLTRQRELDDTPEGRSPKRTRLDHEPPNNDQKKLDVFASGLPEPDSEAQGIDSETAAAMSSDTQSLLPPSHVLLGTSKPEITPDGAMYRILETDVGISEYIARDVPRISGIIKQRYVV